MLSPEPLRAIGRHGASYLINHATHEWSCYWIVSRPCAMVTWLMWPDYFSAPRLCNSLARETTPSALQGTPAVWKHYSRKRHCTWRLAAACQMQDQFLRTWEYTYSRCMLCPWRPTTLINSTQFAELHLSTFVDNTDLESTSFIMHVQWILLV